MADVWLVYEGREPTRGGPWLSVPFHDAVALLELKPEHFLSDPSKTPRFGPQDRDLWFLGYRHIVVEIHPEESRPPDWQAGFYHSPIAPRHAFDRIVRNALGPILGEGNVLRVEHVPSTDSRGYAAAKVTVVLTPGAPQRITGEMSLRANARLQGLFASIEGAEGTPILQYATEDELAYND